MPVRKLKEFLDDNNVKYVAISHSPAFTSQEVAATAHVSGWCMAKTVIVKTNGKMAMCVLPANLKVILQDVREIMGADNVRFATEDEFKSAFPECDVGAMPPFGNLYGMDVYVAPTLAENEEIAFNAGSHTEVIKMSYHDFARLVEPKVVEFTT
jgi:Ala-tRNA(Pro) deacylase